MARGRRIVWDSSDDEFADMDDVRVLKAKPPIKPIGTPVAQTDQPAARSTVRRRKLGVVSDNVLLRPLNNDAWIAQTPGKKDAPPRGKRKSLTPQKIELQTRSSKPPPAALNAGYEDLSETESIQEQTIIEGFSEDEEGEQQAEEVDDDDGGGGGGGSDFEASLSSGLDDDSFDLDDIRERRASKPQPTRHNANKGEASRNRTRSPSPGSQLLAEALEAEERDLEAHGLKNQTDGKGKSNPFVKKKESSRQSSSPLNPKYRLPELHFHGLEPPRSQSPTDDTDRPLTPTSSPPRWKPKGLVSPTKKIPRIPATPHHPKTDTFWDQGFIDDWNDEHSPKKQLFLDSSTGKSPSKKAKSPTKRGGPSQKTVQRATKKAFSESKQEVASRFLQELDERITKGRISELSASTGGVRIEWANKLNTTAGRANWRRETARKKNRDGEIISVEHKHHASIELSTKVIDDSHRLLNVIAHEFCHLANFMISGVTKNPHGREFKDWAAKVTREFGDRGVEVTTRHSYDIDFKYVWECTECGLEFKRHSKSINTERHRCGSCKGELKQTKPVPRAKPGKESEYQRFMKEQMKVIKEENPGSPQKEIMRMVASRWSQQEKAKGSRAGKDGSGFSLLPQAGRAKDKVEGVTKSLDQLTIVDLT